MNKYVRLAKRENNNKRGFLIVNPYLGKHVAMNPSDILKMFDNVATLTPYGIVPDRTLVIGFAETATALGIRYAVKNGTYFIQTTREKTPFATNRLYFSEEHSHATEQYIVKDYVDKIINSIDRIIFIDDEITTGNTVLNAIKAINNAYDKEFKYDVVSVLNSMNEEQRQTYSDKNIGVYFLSHIDNSDYEDIAKSLNPDGLYHIISGRPYDNTIGMYETTHVFNDTRMLAYGEEYSKDCDAVMNELKDKFKNSIHGNNVLVLGTEEFMYPGLMFAEMLQRVFDKNVKFHATTRSPISVSADDTYPLHERYEIKSVYDANRTTYVYDLDKYDSMFIVTEAEYLNKDGLNTLLLALHNQNITVITI